MKATLMREGVKKFADPQKALLALIAETWRTAGSGSKGGRASRS
jgi:hypothetical protein